MERRRLIGIIVVLGLLVGGIALVAASVLGGDEAEAPDAEQIASTTVEPHTIVFVVLDSVRSQNASLCGYDRPTTPFLDALRRDGAAGTCDAYAPGTWTLASHASYFTGLSISEHGLNRATPKLSKRPDTLASALQRRGYRTVMVAPSKVLPWPSGIQRGFDAVLTELEEERLVGPTMAKGVAAAISRVDPNKPLFLFVNVYDAHDPYPAIPQGVNWAPQQAKMWLSPTNPDPKTPYNQFMSGSMPADHAEIYLAQLTNGYDYGVLTADRVLTRIFAALEATGRLKRSHRWLVTADHGQFLGEHGALRHDCCVYQQTTRVPFLFRDSTLEEQPAITGPLSATSAFSLVLDGLLPDPPLPVVSISENRGPNHRSANMVALWPSTTEKLVWREGEFARFDLTADPEEAHPLVLDPAHPHRAQLEALVENHKQSLLPPAVKAKADAAAKAAAQAAEDVMGGAEDSDAGPDDSDAAPEEAAPPAADAAPAEG